MKQLISFPAVLMLVMCLSSSSALAALILPSNFAMTINNGLAQTTVTENDLNLTGPDGNLFNTTGAQQTGMWMYAWNFDLDPDPLVSGSFTFTNLTPNDVNVSILLHLPINAPFVPGLQSGSFSGSFKDQNNSGAASLQNVTWDGLIDGSSTFNIFAFDASCSGSPPGCMGSVFSIDPDPEIYGPGVSSSIGTEIALTLSAGDQATLNTTFEVVPVPVPGAALLFWTGLATMFGWRWGRG